MEVTRTGNIKIRVNPERHYSNETWVGTLYYKRSELEDIFGKYDWENLDEEDCTFNEKATNREMIMYHVDPFRKVGYVVK